MQLWAGPCTFPYMTHISDISPDEAVEPTEVVDPTRVLFTVPEASNYLRISRTTLYSLMREGAVESFYLGPSRKRGRRFIPEDSLRAYVDRRRREALEAQNA